MMTEFFDALFGLNVPNALQKPTPLTAPACGFAVALPPRPPSADFRPFSTLFEADDGPNRIILKAKCPFKDAKKAVV